MRVFLLFVLPLLLVRGAWADDLRVEATLDRNVIGLGETASLQVSVTGSGQISSDPRLPPLPQFTVMTAGSSQNVSIVNGDVSTSFSIRYVLIPRAVGTFTIGPIQVEAAGRTAKSEPLALEVTKGNGSTASVPSYPPMVPGVPVPMPGVPPGIPLPGTRPPAPADTGGRGPAFVTAQVDNKSPYVGQVVTWSLRFYHVPGVMAGNLQPPNTTGFITEDLPPQKDYTEVVDGREYEVNEVKLALIPTVEGTHKMGAARIVCTIPGHVPRLPGLDDDEDFPLVFRRTIQKELASDPIELTVRPLPKEGQDDEFTGGVGRFKLDARLDDATGARVGQPLNLELTVEGEGNIKLVQAPRLPAMPGFKVYDPVAGGNLTKADYKLAGTRKFTIVLVPTAAGTLEIPPVSMSYFDPQVNEYRTLSTRAMKIAVAPGTSTAAASPSPSPASVDARGLRPNHTASALSRPRSLLDSPLFRALQAAPLLILVGALLMWGPRLRRAPRGPRAGAALKRAQTQLRHVPQLSGLPPILYGYLSEKLGASASGMSTRELLDALAVRGVGPTELGQLEQLLAAAERARYAPMQPEAPPCAGPIDVQASVTDAERLLSQLERSLK